MRFFLTLSRKTNVLVLSQDIDDDTIQTLVGVALGDLFPEQCKNWRARKQNVRDVFSRKRTNSEREIAQNVAKSEDSLRHALREGVVDHVTSLFPYCFHLLDRGYGTYLILQVVKSL